MNEHTKKNIVVSIMVTYFNQIKYIKDSLMSILSQEVSFDFEILCGDDGSTDGTYEELLSWQSKYPDIIKLYRMPRNSDEKYEPIHRVSNNRRTLLKHAKGKYICFLDGDDFFINKKKLQKQVNLLEMNKRCIACGHPFQIYDDESAEFGNVQYLNLPDKKIIIPRKVYWSYYWLHADSFLFRNILTNTDRFDIINQNLFDDNLITAYFIDYGDIIYVPDPMVAYRQISNSSWNSRNKLQKSFVDLCMYQESSRITKMKIANFIRCFHAFRILYLAKESEIVIDDKMSNILKIKFVQRTIQYKKSNMWFRFFYILRYGMVMNMGAFIKLLRKSIIFSYRKAKEKNE